MATSKLTGITIDEYNDVMADVLGTGGYGKDGKWNGLLILPILSIALSFLSTKLLSGSQAQPPAPPQDAQGEGAEKAPVATTNHEDDAIRHAHNDGRVRTVLFGCVCALYVHKFVMRDSVPAHFQSYRKTRR